MSTSSKAQLDYVLLNVHAYAGMRRNSTTASSTTRDHKKIEVTLCPAPPPLPSNLFVYCPELDPTGGFTVLPRILRAEGDLILLRVAIDCRCDHISTADYSDYFVYKAAGAGTRSTREPSLRRLLRPHPSFHDDDVGLLSRGDHFTVAALIASGTLDVYNLHLFHSESEVWIHRKVSVVEPQRGFPLLIPENCGRLTYHDTSTVIAIGGEGGTMGWVDLWRGMLLCDVLQEKPMLRGVPLPLPLELVSCNDGLGTELGCPKSIRGIALIKGAGAGVDVCLKLLHLEANTTQLYDGTGSPSFVMHNWAIVTWSNTKMTSSWKDWRLDGRVQASDFTMDSQIKSELLQSGLLLEPLDGTTAGRALQNLLVSDPASDICAADGNIVYLMAREKFLHPKAWVLSLDLKNNTLLGAAEFGTERQPSAPAMYCPSTISKHMNQSY